MAKSDKQPLRKQQQKVFEAKPVKNAAKRAAAKQAVGTAQFVPRSKR